MEKLQAKNGKITNSIDSMESDVSYRCIGEDFDEGVVACGFMRKRTKSRSQMEFRIGYYSGFFLLSGGGVYVTGNGTEIPIRAGDFVQRLPNEVHSTYVKPDGEWLEFFISFGKGRYEILRALDLLPEECVSRCPIQKKLPECAAHLECLKKISDGELGIALASQERSLNMENVAKQLAIGYETFRKQFRRQMGVSPADYRLRAKMRQACHMLDAGFSIKETAGLTGYADVYTFTRQFKKTVGVTPGVYGKTNQPDRL